MSIKPIELTEKHKEMLLEMCNELFPECGFEWFANELRFLDHPKDKYLTFIHWFEFCMNDLAGNIYKKHFKIGTEDDWFGSHYNWVCFALNTKKPNKIHIVDYLYEQFIKIKDNDIKEEKK